MSCVTGWSVFSDRPRSPCSTPPIQCRYWIGGGIVEVILVAQHCQDLGAALLAGQHQNGVARQQLLQREGEDRHEQQRRDRQREAGGRCSSAWGDRTLLPPAGEGVDAQRRRMSGPRTALRPLIRPSLTRGPPSPAGGRRAGARRLFTCRASRSAAGSCRPDAARSRAAPWGRRTGAARSRDR